jgi:LDH2 family malate/lactate/ureidoglycolate dehydrogenase
MGGYKGLGLAYVVDILAGLITGGAFLDGMKGMYKYPNDPSLTGHLMIALKTDAIMDREEMQHRMTDYYHKIKASPMWDESSEMMLPGEIEYRTSLERREKGLPLPVELLDELQALGVEMGVSNQLS